MSTTPPTTDEDPSTKDQEALKELFSVKYDELLRYAVWMHSKYPSFTLSPTAVLNEVFMKLLKSPGFATTAPEKLMPYAVHVMRQILIDGARKVRAEKRGGQAERVTLDESRIGAMLEASSNRAEDLLALDQALDALAEHDSSGVLVSIVELRFFGGFTWAEIAEKLGVSESKVQRDWRAARAWLHAKLRKLPPAES